MPSIGVSIGPDDSMMPPALNQVDLSSVRPSSTHQRVIAPKLIKLSIRGKRLKMINEDCYKIIYFLYCKLHIQSNISKIIIHNIQPIIVLRSTCLNGSLGYKPTITEGIEIPETDVLVFTQFYNDALNHLEDLEDQKTRARFLCLARRKLRLCSANHRPGHWRNLPCDRPSTAWAYSE